MLFPGGIESVSNGLLIFSAALGVLFFYMRDLPQSWKRSAVKTGSIALLAMLAIQEDGPWLLVVALAFGALGDFLLSRDGEPYFLAGLGAFLASHLVYVALFLSLGAATVGHPLFWAGAIALATMCFVLLRPIVGHAPQGLRVPVSVYGLAILAMGVSALATGRPAVIVGALMFMASDAFLGWEKFVEPQGSSRKGWIRAAVWVLYYLAQATITLGVLMGR